MQCYTFNKTEKYYGLSFIIMIDNINKYIVCSLLIFKTYIILYLFYMNLLSIIHLKLENTKKT